MSDTPLLTAILIVHAAATWVMLGVIWFVQLVHYPLMDRVRTEPSTAFPDFEKAHQRGTTLIVAPAMLLELATAVWLVAALPAGPAVMLAWFGLAMVAVNWVSTAALQMPCHRKLEKGFDAATHRRLVRGNWVRTAAWSVRGVIAAGLLAVA
jgi:hypothetical protein